MVDLDHCSYATIWAGDKDCYRGNICYLCQARSFFLLLLLLICAVILPLSIQFFLACLLCAPSISTWTLPTHLLVVSSTFLSCPLCPAPPSIYPSVTPHLSPIPQSLCIESGAAWLSLLPCWAGACLKGPRTLTHWGAPAMPEIPLLSFLLSPLLPFQKSRMVSFFYFCNVWVAYSMCEFQTVCQKEQLVNRWDESAAVYTHIHTAVFMRLIYVITSLGPLMYTSKAAAAHFMYASLAWFGHLMSSSHIFLLIPRKPKEQGIAGTAGGKKGWGWGAHGGGQWYEWEHTTDWRGHHLHAPYIGPTLWWMPAWHTRRNDAEIHINKNGDAAVGTYGAHRPVWGGKPPLLAIY